MCNNKYLESLLEEYSYPEAAREAYREIDLRLELFPDLSRSVQEARALLFDTPIDDKRILAILSDAAERLGVPRYTMVLYALLCATERLCECWREMGIPEEIIKDNLKDFRVKNDECHMFTGIYGSFSDGWLIGWFKRGRFTFGRLQFEITTLLPDEAQIGGREFKKGDSVIGVHIPRFPEPFTPEARLASYKAAYKFFRESFEDDLLPFICGSWLLFSALRQTPLPLQMSSSLSAPTRRTCG